MKRKTLFRIGIGVIAFLAVIMVSAMLFIEPWLCNKIEAALNDKNKEYTIELGGVDILFFSPGIELKRIKLISKKAGGLSGEIRSVKAKGVGLKALYNKDIDIRELRISKGSLRGNYSSPEEKNADKDEESQPTVSPVNIHIGNFVFEGLNVSIGDTASSLAYSIKEGVFKFSDIKINKQDTLSSGIVKEFEFEAGELFLISRDSLHTFSAKEVSYSTVADIFSLKSFSIHPNFTDHAYTARFKYETDRIEASGNDFYIHGISVQTYLKSGDIVCSYVEIGKLDMKVFRDKRKEFKHVNKPTFQELMYNYPNLLDIDSIGLIKGNITYTEHAEGANEAGYITFNNINAKIYGVSNDSIYKTEKGFVVLKCNAMLMGKARMDVVLKGELYEPQNTFSVNGSVAAMDAGELNPILEKNGFVYASGGKIDEMKFSFTANNTKSTGTLTMLYHDLDITLKNKRTDDTTAFKERFISMIANKFVINSNPSPGDEVRVGIIEYERDPEKFLFNYCVKSILSGIKTSVTKMKNNGSKERADKLVKKNERKEKVEKKKAEKAERKK